MERSRVSKVSTHIFDERNILDYSALTVHIQFNLPSETKSQTLAGWDLRRFAVCFGMSLANPFLLTSSVKAESFDLQKSPKCHPNKQPKGDAAEQLKIKRDLLSLISL